jgi:hypothetical protein
MRKNIGPRQTEGERKQRTDKRLEQRKPHDPPVIRRGDEEQRGTALLPPEGTAQAADEHHCKREKKEKE